MAPDAKITQLAELVMGLKKKVVQLEEKMTPRTPPKVLAQRRDAVTKVAKEIENSKQTCAKAMDQVSQTWKALMDDE